MQRILLYDFPYIYSSFSRLEKELRLAILRVTPYSGLVKPEEANDSTYAIIKSKVLSNERIERSQSRLVKYCKTLNHLLLERGRNYLIFRWINKMSVISKRRSRTCGARCRFPVDHSRVSRCDSRVPRRERKLLWIYHLIKHHLSNCRQAWFRKYLKHFYHSECSLSGSVRTNEVACVHHWISRERTFGRESIFFSNTLVFHVSCLQYKYMHHKSICAFNSDTLQLLETSDKKCISKCV